MNSKDIIDKCKFVIPHAKGFLKEDNIPQIIDYLDEVVYHLSAAIKHYSDCAECDDEYLMYHNQMEVDRVAKMMFDMELRDTFEISVAHAISIAAGLLWLSSYSDGVKLSCDKNVNLSLIRHHMRNILSLIEQLESVSEQTGSRQAFANLNSKLLSLISDLFNIDNLMADRIDAIVRHYQIQEY